MRELLGQLSARLLRDDERLVWERLVQCSPQGSVYHLPAYLDALCEAAGGRIRYLGVFRGDALLAGAALYERGSGRGAFVAPRLLLYYNGLLLRPETSRYPSQRTAAALESLEALLPAARALGFGSVRLRCHHSLQDVRVPLALGWRPEPEYSYVVDLSLPFEQVEARVEQNLRRLVRRHEARGAELVEDEDAGAFHALHEQALARHGVAPYLPRQEFTRFFARLRAAGLCRLFHARSAGRNLSSQLVLLGPGGTSHTVAAATHPDELRGGVTAWLRLRSFAALRADGVVSNDLTDAALNSVTHFKSQLGGELRLCFVLQSPRSLRFAAGERLRRAARGVRRRVRSLLPS